MDLNQKIIKYSGIMGYGTYVYNPEVCDVYKNDLCQGGCATRSAYSKIDPATGLVVKNTNPHILLKYSYYS